MLKGEGLFERLSLNSKRYRMKNHERILKRESEYRQKNRFRIRENWMRHAKRVGRIGKNGNA